MTPSVQESKTVVLSRTHVSTDRACALCGDKLTQGFECPICHRIHCFEPCFETHLRARDVQDSDRMLDQFLRSENGEAFREIIQSYCDQDIDWNHIHTCKLCRSDAYEALIDVAVFVLRLATEQKQL